MTQPELSGPANIEFSASEVAGQFALCRALDLDPHVTGVTAQVSRIMSEDPSGIMGSILEQEIAKVDFADAQMQRGSHFEGSFV